MGERFLYFSGFRPGGDDALEPTVRVDSFRHCVLTYSSAEWVGGAFITDIRNLPAIPQRVATQAPDSPIPNVSCPSLDVGRLEIQPPLMGKRAPMRQHRVGPLLPLRLEPVMALAGKDSASNGALEQMYVSGVVVSVD